MNEDCSRCFVRGRSTRRSRPPSSRLRIDNARLRDEARRLREEPAAIEEVARRELGLIRPGETVFIIKDVPRPEAVKRPTLNRAAAMPVATALPDAYERAELGLIEQRSRRKRGRREKEGDRKADTRRAIR